MTILSRGFAAIAALSLAGAVLGVWATEPVRAQETITTENGQALKRAMAFDRGDGKAAGVSKDAPLPAYDVYGAPARYVAAITTSDTVNLTDVPRAIYVGTGGDIVMIGIDAPAGATGMTWKNVPAGTILPFRPRRVLTTGTTAANLLALY